MSKRFRKLVIDERETDVLMSLGERESDPVSNVVVGDLEQALCSLPALLKKADEKWRTSPRNPAYPAAPEPAKEGPKPCQSGSCNPLNA